MNGPFAADVENLPKGIEESCLTDYGHARSAIYMSFAWSKANEAFTAVAEKAYDTGVGFFECSSEKGVILNDKIQFASHFEL